MGSRRSENQFNFEENVRKTGNNIHSSVQSIDELGANFEQIQARTQEGLTEETSWTPPSKRNSPDEDYGSFLGFVEGAANTIESRDNDLENLEEVHDNANEEAYNAMLGLADGKAPERALESDERTVDHMRQQAIKADKDRVVAEKVRESAAVNITSLEDDLLEQQDNLNSNLTEYAGEFEDYMHHMAEFARDEYGAMAELATQLSQLDKMEADSELGEQVISQLEKDVSETLESQAHKVADAYNEMVDAYEATERVEEKLPTDVRDRYEVENQRLQDSLDRADKIFDNMSGCYDSFAERAETMMSEKMSETENLDTDVMEAWSNEYSSERA